MGKVKKNGIYLLINRANRIIIRIDDRNCIGGSMRVSSIQLKENLYQILDNVINNGQSVEIERKGRILRIVPYKPRTKSKLMNLEPHDTIVGDPESIVHVDWSKEWKETDNL